MEPNAQLASDARSLFDAFELGSGSSDCSAAIGFAECGPGCAWCDVSYVCVDRWQDCIPPERAGGFPVLLLLASVGAVGLALWSGGGARGVLSKLGVRAPDDDDFEPRDADSHRASYSLTASHRDTPELRPTPGGFVPPAAALSRAPPEGRRLLEV